MEDIRIYIAEQRGEELIGEGRLRSTLNYGDYRSPHRNPIGDLQYVNEWIGHLDQTFSLLLPAQQISVFVPLTGGILLRIKEQEYKVPLGNLLVLPTNIGSDVLIQQLIPEEPYFTFQQFVFSAADISSKDICSYSLPITNPSDKNRLLPVWEKEDFPFRIYIGAFIGKEEYKLILDATFDRVFALPLDGHFEVEERLLFTGDALSLPGLQELEAECLSVTGLLLVIHF